MKEQFVNYDISLKLESLGFNDGCLAIYGRNDRNLLITDIYIGRTPRRDTMIVAPLWQQVTDWFRKIHGIDIEILSFDENIYTCELVSNDDGRTFTEDSFETYEEAREFGILKAIELLEKRNVNSSYSKSFEILNNSCYTGGFQKSEKYIDCQNTNCIDYSCNK